MTYKHSDSLEYDPLTRQVSVKTTERISKDKGKKKAIIYARVSTEEQKRKGNGINAQISDCERRAQHQDVEIVSYFKDEAVSGTNLSRKWFLNAIKYLEQTNKKDTEIDYFICVATSRFSRSPEINKAFDMVARVEMTGAKLVAIGNGGVQETETEEGLISLTLNFLVDALESKRGQKRVRYGQKWKLYAGYRPFSGAPLGYQRVTEKEGNKEIKIVTIQEPQASIIKEWLELFADGVLLTKRQLLEFYREKSLKSNSPLNKSGKLHLSIIDRMLDTRKLLFYTGNITYPRWGIKEIIPAKHSALISMDTFHKIQLRLKEKYGVSRYATKKYDYDADQYPLKRILLCPSCEKGLTKRKSRSKTGDYHPYYGCKTKGCELYKKSLPRDKVHQAVRDRLEVYVVK